MMERDNVFSITKLVEETFTSVPLGCSPHFSPTREYMIDSSMSFSYVMYIKQIECFRIKVNGRVIDLPSNWSIFSDLKEKLISKKVGCMLLNHSEDVDLLCKALSSEVDYCQGLAIYYDNGISMIATYASDMCSVTEDLSKILYVDKKSVAA